MANYTIDHNEENITTLPTDDPDWPRATQMLLQGNKIEILDASLLPRTLTYLDISENPLKEITGDLPDLTTLLVSDTLLKKLPRLPKTLVEMSVDNTPISKKYGLTRDIKDIMKYSDWPLDKYDIVIDRTEEPEYNSNENGNSNTMNSTSNQQLMILNRLDKEYDVQYEVQTLSGKRKFISKQFLEPYEPALAHMVTPIPAGNEPNVYILEGHGEDILFEKPIPPGCVYVSIEECGVLSSDWFKLLYAFEDNPPGIREKLRDPVRYKADLRDHFGRNFHVHYPEAEVEGDRTYIEHINYPFTGWNQPGKCYIGKSGIYSLDNRPIFTNPSVDPNKPDIEKVTRVVDCNSVGSEDLKYTFSGSLYPTSEMVDILAYEETLYKDLSKRMEFFQYSQSWAFKMFPGIHYNFSCRAIEKHSKTNERIAIRRRLSLEGPRQNIARISNEEIQGVIGIQLLNEAIKVNNMELVKTLVSRGVDVNESALETAIDQINVDALDIFLTVPGINIMKAIEITNRKIQSLEAKEYPKEVKEQIIEAIKDMKASIVSHTKKGGNTINRKTRHRKTRHRKTRRRQAHPRRRQAHLKSKT